MVFKECLSAFGTDCVQIPVNLLQLSGKCLFVVIKMPDIGSFFRIQCFQDEMILVCPGKEECKGERIQYETKFQYAPLVF